MSKVFIYDTTLRDGAQQAGISFSVEDKIRIAQRLDNLGFHYIEGGWPGSNPKDIEFFERMQRIPLHHARLVAFGSTRRPKLSVDKDDNLQLIIEAKVKSATIFGKSWDFHVTNILETSLEENLKMIEESVAFLKEHGLEVHFDAEHFFDGYKHNPEYALETLLAAQKAGADWLVLCDTNGGTLPLQLKMVLESVSKVVQTPLGIHVHDDSGMAVANSVLAVEMGARQVQGTINGLGERCGNANLCSVIPNLELKLGFTAVGSNNLRELTKVSRFVSEVANMIHPDSLPFVGANAFSHKAGVHVSAVTKHFDAYEHIKPDSVGNKRKILVSELAGKSNVIYKARERNIDLEKDTPETKKLLDMIKNMEYDGYQFEGAEASLELLMRRTLRTYEPFFTLHGFRVIVEKKDGDMACEATIKVSVGDRTVHTAAEGNGPVNALDNALRKALEEFYPYLKQVHLVDYKVRVLEGRSGTESKVRVLIESRDEQELWSTVGVSSNIIEASWYALVDSLEYGLLKMQKELEEA